MPAGRVTMPYATASAQLRIGLIWKKKPFCVWHAASTRKLSRVLSAADKSSATRQKYEGATCRSAQDTGHCMLAVP